MIPGFIVSAVCHVPHAAHPSYAQGYYDRDNEFYLAWDQISSDLEATRQYLEEWVYGVKDREEYWAKLGAEKHRQLQVPALMSAPVNYGRY
jgi:glutaconate CoA-transferase subunit A